MEQPSQLGGDRNEITTSDPTNGEDEATTGAPPLTFAEAQKHNPYTLLTELHDHALAAAPNRLPPQQPAHHLAELALSAAVVSWWSRWQPIFMHRAFQAGASLTEVAAAAGTNETEVFERWAAWAEGQVALRRYNHRVGISATEVATIRARLGEPGAATE